MLFRSERILFECFLLDVLLSEICVSSSTTYLYAVTMSALWVQYLGEKKILAHFKTEYKGYLNVLRVKRDLGFQLLMHSFDLVLHSVSLYC